MRLLLLVLFLSLAACAGKEQPEQGPVCASYLSPYMVVYPDKVVRKSDVATCSDGQYKASALDQSGENFSDSKLYVRLKDVNGNYYFTNFTSPNNEGSGK